MSASSWWYVWSLDERSGRWVAVDGPMERDIAKAGVRRRTTNAERYGMGGAYEASQQPPPSRTPAR
jgi:hypothetical protein